MNAEENKTSNRERVGPQMGAMLVAALVIGIAFNSASPLGVRATTGAPQKQPPAADARARGPKPWYENETLSLSLETEAAGIPFAPGAAANPGPNGGRATVSPLTWPETRQLLAGGQIVLVDAREAVYYQTEHIPGAISLPAASPTADLIAFVTKYPKETAIVVYCGSVQCPLSHELVAVLTGQLGYSNVREMPGGFAEYRQVEAQSAKRDAK